MQVEEVDLLEFEEVDLLEFEEVDLLEFEEMLVDDADIFEWDKFDDDVAWGDSFELEV
jgi:hypothetical protein